MRANISKQANTTIQKRANIIHNTIAQPPVINGRTLEACVYYNVILGAKVVGFTVDVTAGR